MMGKPGISKHTRLWRPLEDATPRKLKTDDSSEKRTFKNRTLICSTLKSLYRMIGTHRKPGSGLIQHKPPFKDYDKAN
jgi:hypothetical protein